jgi:hypothetical protein
MPVDTSMYAVPPPPNYLAQGLQAVQLGNSALQNRLLQGQVQGQGQFGNALTSAINPDGTVDTNALGSAVRNVNPYYAPTAAAAVQALRGQNLTNQGATTDQSNTRVNNFYSALGPMALSGQPLTHQQVITEASRRVATGQLLPQDLAAISGMTPMAPKDVNNFVKQRYQSTLPDLSTPTPTINSGGAPTIVPKATFLNSGPAGVPTALPPGQLQATTAAGATAGASSAAQGVDLGKAADSSPIRKGMLGNLETDLQNFTSGPSADWQKVAKAWANRNILPSGMQFNPESIASQEAFTKQAEQLAQQQFQAIGGTGTDAKFGSAFKSNPNDELSKMGNTGIIQLLKGNEDAIQAKNQAWQQWQASGKGPETYPQFAAQFNQTFDPRAFQSQYMNKQDFTKMLKTMGPGEQAQFVGKLKAAQANGYIVSPGAYNAGQ